MAGKTDSPQFSTHHSFILSVWTELQDGETRMWRGVIQGADGKRVYFHTLADLNRLLREYGGWRDPSGGDVPGTRD